MSEIQDIILEELRLHRQETKDGFQTINGRIRSLEESRAEARGASNMRTAITISGAGLLAWLIGLIRH